MKKTAGRIIGGILLIAGGIGFDLWGILPHYYAMAYDRSVRASIPNLPGPYSTPLIIAIPPINYWLIGIGVALMVAGSLLIVSGIRVYRESKLITKS